MKQRRPPDRHNLGVRHQSDLYALLTRITSDLTPPFCRETYIDAMVNTKGSTHGHYACLGTLAVGNDWVDCVAVLVAAVVVGFRQSHADSSISSAGPEDKSASPEIAGPSVWGRDVDAPVKYVPSMRQWRSGARRKTRSSRREWRRDRWHVRGVPRACPHPEVRRLRQPQGIPMSNHKPSMLIFGAPAAFRPRSMPAGMAGSSRALIDDVRAVASQVSVETVAANLRTVMAQVEELLMRGQESAGKLGVAYVDVNLVICADGSVGLLGTAAGTNTKATLTMRLAPRVGSKPSGQGSAEPTICAIDPAANHGVT